MTRGSVTSLIIAALDSPVGFAGGVLRVAGRRVPREGRQCRSAQRARGPLQVAPQSGGDDGERTADDDRETDAERASVPMRKACEVAATNANQESQ